MCGVVSPQGVLFVWVNLFFCFNHPEVANHMKNMLPEKTSGPALSLSTGERHLLPPKPLTRKPRPPMPPTPPKQLLGLDPICCLFINGVTCLQPNKPPLSCRRLFYTQEECNSVPSVLLFCAILCLFACL